MSLSFNHWLAGFLVAVSVHFIAFFALGLRGDQVLVERSAGAVVSIAGSLSGLTSEAEQLVADPVEEEVVEEIDESESETTQDVKPVEPVPTETTETVEEVEEQDTAIPILQKKEKSREEKKPQNVRKKKKPQARSRAASRAGQGGGGHSTVAGNADISNFKGRVRSAIVRRVRSGGGKGTVVVRFTLTASGRPTGIRIVRGATSALNSAALRAVNGGFPPIPAGMPRTMSFTVPIAFR